MPRFTKKPITITAVQITDDTFDGPNPEHIPGLMYHCLRRIVTIPTLDGTMVGNLGDWIITGVRGEHYPCRDDIFRATYAPASDADGEAQS